VKIYPCVFDVGDSNEVFRLTWNDSGASDAGVDRLCTDCGGSDRGSRSSATRKPLDRSIQSAQLGCARCAIYGRCPSLSARLTHSFWPSNDRELLGRRHEGQQSAHGADCDQCCEWHRYEARAGNYQVINCDTGAPLGQGRFAHIWTRSANGEWRLDRDLWNQPVQ
jgi:hypothetical protein